MPDALALVRQHFGADAVILHTRSYKRGGVLGLGARTVIEITAMAGRDMAVRKARSRAGQRTATNGNNRRNLSRAAPASAPRKPQPVLQSAGVGPGGAAGGSGVGLQSEGTRSAVATENAASSMLAGDLIRRTYAAARAELSGSALATTAVGAAAAAPRASGDAAGSAPSVAITPLPQSSVDGVSRLSEELAAVKALVARVAQQQEHEAAVRSAPDVPDPLIDAYTALIQQEVAEELAGQIIREAAEQSASSGDDSNGGTPPAAMIREKLSQYIPVVENPQTPCRDSDGRPRTLALVGPTGVGKTTTVAKLAATFKLKQGLDVGVVTLDTYRIAAVDQLRTYCSIIGTPLEVVGRPQDLPCCLDRLSGCDVVLIDTAGRSQRDGSKLEELAEYLRLARPHETHLVLSSTCSQRVMLETAQRFACVGPDRVIFTKLDEAVTCGMLLNVARRIDSRISYVTTGQEVPHQIEPGNAAMLAERVLGMPTQEVGGGV